MIPLPPLLTLAEITGVIVAAAVWAALRRGAAVGDEVALGRFRRDARLVVLGAAVLVVYLANSARIPTADAQPVAFAAVSLVQHGDLDLDEFRPVIDPVLPFTVTSPAGHLYSMYPPGSAIAAAPFFVVPVLARVPLSLSILDAVAKLSAACWTALSAALLFAALEGYAPRAALVTTLAYAFGTTAFSSAAQDLWQHGPSQAGLALCLLLLTRRWRRPVPGLILGVAMSWAVVCRTSNLLPVLVLLLFVVLAARRTALFVVLGALPLALFTFAYNWLTTGAPWLFAHLQHQGPQAFAGSFATGFAGLLVAPSRGLFVYSPFLLLAAPGVAREVRRLRAAGRQQAESPASSGTAPLAVLGAAGALALVLLVAQWREWPGGWCYGYRVISEAALLLMPAVALAVERLSRVAVGRAVVLVTVLAAVAVHSLHVFFPNDVWNARVIGGRAAPQEVWTMTPSETQIGTHLRWVGAWLRRQPRPSDQDLRELVADPGSAEAR